MAEELVNKIKRVSKISRSLNVMISYGGVNKYYSGKDIKDKILDLLEIFNGVDNRLEFGALNQALYVIKYDIILEFYSSYIKNKYPISDIKEYSLAWKFDHSGCRNSTTAILKCYSRREK